MKCFPNFSKMSFLLPDILARAGHVAFYVDRRLSAREETASQHGHFSSHYFQRLRFNNSAIICFLWNQDVSKFGLYNRILYNRSLGSLGQTSSLISGDITPFSVNFFPLTFRKNLVRGGPGGGGGYPPNGKFPCLGFLNPSLTKWKPRSDPCCLFSLA